MSEYGKHIWSVDPDLFGNPKEMNAKWKELYGEEFNPVRAYNTANHAGHRAYYFTGGRIAVADNDGWHIYEVIDESENT